MNLAKCRGITVNILTSHLGAVAALCFMLYEPEKFTAVMPVNLICGLLVCSNTKIWGKKSFLRNKKSVATTFAGSLALICYLGRISRVIIICVITLLF